jgi:hypothetical protein
MALQNTQQILSSARTIDSFKSRLTQGGARPNLFEVELNFPAAIPGLDEIKKDTSYRMMVKAAQLPASNLVSIPVAFRGRQLKVSGDRTFDPWQIQIVNDGDFKLREAFEKWANFIVKVSDGSGTVNPADYQVDWVVHQLGRAPYTDDRTNNNEIPKLRSYKFSGCWPSTVGAIDLSYENVDTIEEFPVTLEVQYWEAFNANQQDSVV